MGSTLRLGLDALWRPVRRAVRAVRTTHRTISAVPDVVEAILVLPRLSQQLELVGLHTSTLPEMHAEIRAMRTDTSHLPAMSDSLRRMCDLVEQLEGNTSALEQLVEVAVPLTGAAQRFGRLADRLPQRRVVLSAAAEDGTGNGSRTSSRLR